MKNNGKKIRNARINNYIFNLVNFDYDYMPFHETNGSRRLLADVIDLPFRSPKGYSLNDEASMLVQMSSDVMLLRKKVCKSDREALAMDWVSVGKDLDGAVRRYAGKH